MALYKVQWSILANHRPEIRSRKSVSKSVPRIQMMSHHMSKPCETLPCSPDFHDTLLALASFHSHFTSYTMEGPYTGHLIDRVWHSGLKSRRSRPNLNLDPEIWYWDWRLKFEISRSRTGIWNSKSKFRDLGSVFGIDSEN